MMGLPGVCRVSVFVLSLSCLGGCGTSGSVEGATPASGSGAAAPPGRSAGPGTASVASTTNGPGAPGGGPFFGRVDDIALGGSNVCVREGTTARCVGDWPIQFDNGMRGQEFVAPIAVSGLSGVRSMTVQVYRGCAILDDGTVRCWGNTTPGQHNWIGAQEGRLDAAAVPELHDVVDLALGWSGSCALTKAGRITCWGPAFKPFRAKGNFELDGVKQIAADKTGLCALLKDGTVRCFPGEWDPRAASSSGTEALEPVAGLSGVTQISVGASNNCALTRTGNILCWGANGNGQLGDGTLERRQGPVPVKDIHDAVQAEAGHDYSCALTRDKKVFCWGYNGSCVVGDEHRECVKQTMQFPSGTSEREYCPVPQRISLPIEPVRISLGYGTGCAIDAGGRVACWGRSVSRSGGGCRGWML